MSIRFGLSLLALMLLGLGMSLPLSAENSGCDEINWKQQLLVVVDDMESACQEVVVTGGKSYVRFEVEFVKLSNDGYAQVLMVMNDGTRVERSIPAPKNFQVRSQSGKTDYKLRELSRGDILDVLIPVSRVVAANPK